MNNKEFHHIYIQYIHRYVFLAFKTQNNTKQKKQSHTNIMLQKKKERKDFTKQKQIKLDQAYNNKNELN